MQDSSIVGKVPERLSLERVELSRNPFHLIVSHSRLMGVGLQISTQGLAIDFLKKGSVDWKGGAGVDSEVSNRELEEEDNSDMVLCALRALYV